MINIRLSRKGNRVNIRHTKRNMVLKTAKRNIRLVHTGSRGVAGEQGPIGPQGEQGIQGVPGAGVPTGGLTNQILEKASNTDYDYKWSDVTSAYADKNYTQDFVVSDTVLVTHNLNKLPAVNVVDSANDEVEGEITYINTNQLLVRFTYPFSGKVTCN